MLPKKKAQLGQPWRPLLPSPQKLDRGIHAADAGVKDGESQSDMSLSLIDFTANCMFLDKMGVC